MRLSVGKMALVTALLAPATLAAQEGTSGFEVSRSKDPIDDTNRSIAMTAAIEESDREPAFGWQCMEDGLNVVYNFATYFGGDDDNGVTIRYRFDEDPPSGTESWQLLTGNRSVYVPMDQVAEFTRKAQQARLLSIRVTDPLDGETYTDQFNLAGAAEAIEEIGACK
jgi:hypothetical protein